MKIICVLLTTAVLRSLVFCYDRANMCCGDPTNVSDLLPFTNWSLEGAIVAQMTLRAKRNKCDITFFIWLLMN